MRTRLPLGLGMWPILLSATLARADVQAVAPNETTGTAAAVIVDNEALTYTAQVLPLDKDGALVGKGQAEVQIERALDNLDTVLKVGIARLDRAVKLNVYLTKPELVEVVEKALAKRFAGKQPPAITFVVGNLAHADALIALDAVAVAALKPKDGVPVRSRALALPHDERETHAALVRPGPRIYVSGDAAPGDLPTATRLTMQSLGKTLQFLKLTPSDVVQVKVFARSLKELPAMKKEIAAFFTDKLLPPLVFVEGDAGQPVEIELVAAGTPDASLNEPIEYLTPPDVKASPLYSRVARINHGKTIYLSGLYGQQADNAEGQVKEIFTTLGDLLKKSGSDFRHMAKATYYVADVETSQKLNELRPSYYDPKRPPAASKIMVSSVGRKGKGITIDMIAVPVP